MARSKSQAILRNVLERINNPQPPSRSENENTAKENSENSEKIKFPETQVKIPKAITIITDVPAAKPSMPSVKFEPFETAVIIKTTTAIKIIQPYFSSSDCSQLSDVRRNRIQSLNEDRPSDYTNEKGIYEEIENSKTLFKRHNWPIIDVTRKSVEETAASIIKTLDILNSRK